MKNKIFNSFILILLVGALLFNSSLVYAEAVGAVGGGVAGLTFGVGTALLGTGAASTIGVFGASEALGSGTGQLTSNLLNDRPLTENVGESKLFGAGTSIATAGIAKLGDNLFNKDSNWINKMGFKETN